MARQATRYRPLGRWAAVVTRTVSGRAHCTPPPAEHEAGPHRLVPNVRTRASAPHCMGHPGWCRPTAVTGLAPRLRLVGRRCGGEGGSPLTVAEPERRGLARCSTTPSPPLTGWTPPLSGFAGPTGGPSGGNASWPCLTPTSAWDVGAHTQPSGSSPPSSRRCHAQGRPSRRPRRGSEGRHRLAIGRGRRQKQAVTFPPRPRPHPATPRRAPPSPVRLSPEGAAPAERARQGTAPPPNAAP
ncbi:hypothetical protein QFZ67_000247 [Streptomyces sp. V1I1]|nr:hypothetical protein [Streptomyces sp. V1I1]